MEIITSQTNATVKRLGRLKLKKYRDQSGEFFTEGYKNVLDTCAAAPELVRLIVLSESAYKKTGERFVDFDTVVLSDTLFDKVCETKNSQGVLSVNALPRSAFPQSERCILLDRVRDPGNVGTILRTAVACGYDVVVNNCADIYSPKVTRSAMSAVLKCNIGVDISVEEIKKAGYEIIAADMGGENVFKFESPRGKYCVIVGNEADGVSDGILRCADRTASIPQNNMESLNAAVAAGIIMFTLRYGANN